MSLIDDVLPATGWSEFHRVRVAASPARAYAAIRGADLGGSFVSRALLAARGMRSPFGTGVVTLDALAPRGFVVVAETPGVEVVLGLVGRFWTPRGSILRIDPAAFGVFDEPGYAKAAWNFRVEPGSDGCVVTTETRVVATDEGARRSFGRYWFVIRPFSGLIRRQALAAIKREAERE